MFLAIISLKLCAGYGVVPPAESKQALLLGQQADQLFQPVDEHVKVRLAECSVVCFRESNRERERERDREIDR